VNIIEVVSDTLRRDYLGCYGNSWVHTENLDRFAEESIIFDRAYVASFPTIPHRHDLFTGRYTFTYSGWTPLPRDEVILSQTLKQSGYTTMLIADTYHLIKNGYFFDRGFDGWQWIRGQEGDRYMTHTTNDSQNKKDVFGSQYLSNVSLRRFESDYFVAQTVATAEKWLELNYDRHDKWFLHIDSFDPHEPWNPPKWYTYMYDSECPEEVPGIAYVPDRARNASELSCEQLKHLRTLYAGEVTLVDRWIGRLLQKIEDLGLFEDTMIIFTSDHGTYLGEHGYIGKRPILYEEVAHIPLIIRPPDSLGCKAGRSSCIVQTPDLMPTILDLAEAKIPETVQGKTLLPIMKGEEGEEYNMALSTTGIFHQKVFPSVTVTTDKWCLHDFLSIDSKNKPELYNLTKDPAQTTNLFTENNVVVTELRAKIPGFLKKIRADEDIITEWTK